jgi:tetratricopeptide (TPR) repeat protein
MLTDDELDKAYFQTYRSIEAAERFMRAHPEERDLCAGALLNIAALQERQDKRKAIEAYQKAISDYADEIVPDKNANITVANWALFRVARLERDTGNREKALDIFAKLMTASDFNTRTSSRIEYLATKQSNLKVIAGVSVQGKGPFSLGTRIPVAVSVKNPNKEAVTFKCYARIEHREHRSYHALAPREGCEEITLEPGESRIVPMVFTEKDTQGIEPGMYSLEASLTGIPFDTDSESLKIEK